MVKIGATFEQVQTATSALAGTLGKEVELAVSGGDTDLDKSMVENLGEPLLRLVRNALEHGIEAVEDRLAADKPIAGQIALRAFHDSASIVIEVADDGLPLDAEAIRAQATALGLVQEDHVLADEELFDLLFEPGFPGRGAGLDQVKDHVAALRGTVTAHSSAEEGTRFSIRLPLTLAIIDGFLTGVEKSSYVIPLDSVVECLELSNASADRDYINLRGEVLPYVRLRELFDVPGETPARENVVVVHYGGQQAGIVVDQLLGEFQTVIKPLGTLFRNIHGIGGSTILGSGEVALILDVQALVSHSVTREEQRAARQAPAQHAGS